MKKQSPTILHFGMPNAVLYQNLLNLSHKGFIGLTLDSGKARDPIFSFYENLARADVIIASPNAHPAHLVSLIAEGEVGHPLILQGKVSKVSNDEKTPFSIKPIIFYGTEEEWGPFQEQFKEMRSQDLIREGFDRVVYYAENFNDMLEYISASLTQESPSTRLHYYTHSLKSADLSIATRENSRLPSNITVSFFGSASSRNREVLQRAGETAAMATRNDWNVLHGGGESGVMGQLSRSGGEENAYLYGISVDFSGAPKIYFERDEDHDPLKLVDHFVASKDMLHRIETYALHSKAFVALDGGIGSLQEILVIAELLAAQHPAVTYHTKGGKTVLKPLCVQNTNDIYTQALRTLDAQGFSYLHQQIQVVHSTEMLEDLLQRYFTKYPPVDEATLPDKELREIYFTANLPTCKLRRDLHS